MEVFGASKVEAALQNLSISTQVIDNSVANGKEQIKVRIVSQNEDAGIMKEGFRISTSVNSYMVTAIDASGAMYGLLDMAEQIEMQKGFDRVEE